MLKTEDFFKDIFKNARENSVLILSTEGVILHTSRSFSMAFGYRETELAGKHFRILFTEADQKLKKPESEVKTALSKGSRSDNNYLLRKDGIPVWVVGESIKVQNNNHTYLVKIIHNIDAQKQLERFLLESSDFVDTIFDSIKDTSLVILDSSLKTVKINKAFLKMFSLKKIPAEGTRLSSIENEFWKKPELRQDITAILVNRKSLRNKKYAHKIKGKEFVLNINSKVIEGDEGDKKILLVISPAAFQL
ncbi:MAG: PAS domain-containing protein [Ferruginibacter sp.]